MWHRGCFFLVKMSSRCFAWPSHILYFKHTYMRVCFLLLIFAISGPYTDRLNLLASVQYPCSPVLVPSHVICHVSESCTPYLWRRSCPILSSFWNMREILFFLPRLWPIVSALIYLIYVIYNRYHYYFYKIRILVVIIHNSESHVNGAIFCQNLVQKKRKTSYIMKQKSVLICNFLKLIMCFLFYGLLT